MDERYAPNTDYKMYLIGNKMRFVFNFEHLLANQEHYQKTLQKKGGGINYKCKLHSSYE